MEIKYLLDNFKHYDQQEVTIYGWMRNKRTGKNVSFLQVNDGTAFETIQIVFSGLSNQDEVEKFYLASAIEVKGTLKALENNKQAFEIEAKEINLLASSKDDYPLQPKKHSYEFLREIAHLRMRTNTFNAVFRIRSLLSYAIHDYFNQEGFVMTHTPLLTANDGEGAGEMFNVTTFDLDNKLPKDEEDKVDFSKDFFDKKVNLTVTGQLEAEAYALAFKKVYTFGPTFRAENSNTTRHAAEFWMIEPEIAFAELNDVIKLAQDLLVYAVKYVLEHAASELKFLDSARQDLEVVQRLENLANSKFNEITYKEAIILLEQAIKDGKKFENDVFYGVDLATEHERYLTDELFKAPVFVTNYPREIKAFYMRLNEDNETVAATDLLVPGIGELLGGSQREERYDILQDLMKIHNLEEEDYNWYLQLREYGGVKHAGFGIGFERLVMYVTGMENIRDVIPFPRTPRNCDF